MPRSLLVSRKSTLRHFLQRYCTSLPGYTSLANAHQRLHLLHQLHFRDYEYFQMTLKDFASCVTQGPVAWAIPVFSHVIIIWFGVCQGRTQADEGRCWPAAEMMAVGCCEEVGGGWQVAALEAVKSCDAGLGSWFWQRSCSSLDAEVRVAAFRDHQVPLPQQLRGSAADCWYYWIFTSAQPSQPGSSFGAHPLVPAVLDLRKSSSTKVWSDCVHRYFY
jgi:hypothetical protein